MARYTCKCECVWFGEAESVFDAERRAMETCEAQNCYCFSEDEYVIYVEGV